MKYLVIIILSLIHFLAAAQVNVDSLERLMNASQGDEQIRLMINLGYFYAETDPEKGIELGLKAAFLSKRTGNQQFEGQSLLLMGLSSLNSGQQENAIRYYNRALTHYEKLNQLNEQVTALQGIARVYKHVKNYEMSIRYSERALELAKQLNRPKLQLDIHQQIGEIALSQKTYSRAYQEFSTVLNLIGEEKKLDRTGLNLKAKAYRQLGYVYRNLGQIDESISSYRKASSVEGLLNNIDSQMDDYFEIALSFFLKQNLDSALIFYNRVLSYNQLQNDSVNMVNVLQSIGDVFFELEQYQQAVASYSQSYEIAQKVNNVQAQVTALVNISRCFSAFNDYPSSKEYLSRALQIANRESLLSSAADVYLYLSQVSEAEGRYLQALEFYKLWAELRDSIYTEESGQKLARMQILYEITQKERENEILRQNSEIQQLLLTKTRYQRMVFVVLVVLLLVVLVLLILFFSVKQREFIKQKETELRIVEMNKNLERRMIAEIKKQEKQQLLLAQKSKLESLGTLAAGIAHEINQPLGGISMGLDNILIKLSDSNVSETYLKEKLNLMFENVDRIKRIIEHIRTFSRSHKPASFERVDINEVINSALTMLSAQYGSQNVDLVVNLKDNLDQIIGDKYKLEQVVLNLISNAKFAVDEKEKLNQAIDFRKIITIESGMDDDNVFFSVTDNGIGIKQSNMEKIFDPFFTTKKEDKGTGLGLSISYGFIKDILGEIKVESQEGIFTRFEVFIPKS